MSAAKFFIVVFDDEQGLCCPYGFDPGCQGALEGDEEPIAIFTSRKLARQAIKISKLNALLLKERGEVFNSDFVDSIASVKIRECQLLEPEAQP